LVSSIQKSTCQCKNWAKVSETVSQPQFGAAII
jgi:hypothetical protein